MKIERWEVDDNKEWIEIKNKIDRESNYVIIVSLIIMFGFILYKIYL